jgi:hypothetical protein
MQCYSSGFKWTTARNVFRQKKIVKGMDAAWVDKT